MESRLKKIREEKHLTQEELSVKSGISRTTISGLENGSITNTTSKTLLSLAQALESSVEAIFFTQTV